MESEYAAHLEHLDFYIFAGLFLLSLLTGRIIERLHYRSIDQREDRLGTECIKSGKSISVAPEAIRETRLVCGEAVVAAEFSRWVMGAFKGIFGGNIRSYESVIDRTRREALLRMYADAGNAVEVVNVRLEYTPISYGISSKSSCVEAIAYGTAIYLRTDGVGQGQA